MDVIALDELPAASLLQDYRQRRAYTDAFRLDLPAEVDLADYIEAFYTTPLFKLERLVLAVLVARPSSDAQAKALASGEVRAFAAWTVEARLPDQIVMCDYLGKTRSWLMCEPGDGTTRLYFGSAIVPKRIRADGQVDLGVAFHLLLGFHRVYSRALLHAAASRLLKGKA